MMNLLNHFNHSLEQYRKGKWAPAIADFNDALHLNQADKLSQLYIDRCEHLRKHPPNESWNGDWVLTSK
jgi:adenylate cyclase